MKILLKEEIKKLGHAGDVVNVKDGYGRNFLVPYGKAYEITDTNARMIEEEKKRLDAIEAERVGGLKEVAERISASEVTIKALVSSGENLYGAIQASQIAAALKEVSGIEVDADMVSPTEPVKKIGVHRVPVKLHSTVVAELKVWVVEEKAEGDEDEAPAEEAEEAAAETEATEEEPAEAE